MIEFAANHDVMTELNGGAFADARVSAEAFLETPSDLQRRPVYEYATGVGIDPEDTLDQAALVYVYTVDADKVLERLHGYFDVILIDLPDPNSVELVKLYSREFYLKVNRLLVHGGILAVQSTSPYHAKESFLCILRTIQSAGYDAIPYHDNVPSFGDWGWIMAWNSGESMEDVLLKIAKVKRFNIGEDSLQYLTPQRLHASLSFGKNELVTGNTEVNSLMSPTLLRFYLTESWQR